MHSHSYFKTHLQFFIFQFHYISTILFTFKPHSSLLKNIFFHKKGNWSCYVYTNTIILVSNDNATMHAHKIDYYCYCRHCFTVFALWVISYIAFFIHSTIVVNSEVGVVVLFDWIQCSFYLTDSIFSMHSHSYFKTHLIVFQFITFVLNFLFWSHTICFWNNLCRRIGKSSFYVFTNIFFMIFTYEY